MTRPRDIADGINRIDTSAADATAITIDSSENVGIGTSSPTRTLYVDGQIGASGRIHTASGSATDCGLGIGDDNTGFFRAATNTIGISTNGTERIRINSTGALLVGATTSVGQIATFIGGTNATTAGTVYFGNGGGSAVFAAFGDTGNTTVYGYIQRSGSGLNYVSNSDYRLKENVTDITDGVERVKQLNPSRFNFIADADTTVDADLDTGSTSSNDLILTICFIT